MVGLKLLSLFNAYQAAFSQRPSMVGLKPDLASIVKNISASQRPSMVRLKLT
jgi:hypothetical protein